MSGNNWSNNWPSQQDHQQQQGYYNYQQQGYTDYQLQSMQRSQGRIVNQQMNDYLSYQPQFQHNIARQPQQQNHHNYMMRQQPQTFMFNANANVFVPRASVHSDYAPQSHQYYGGQSYGNVQQNVPYGVASSSSYNTMYGQEDAGIDAFAQFGQQAQQFMPSKDIYDQIVASRASSLLNELQVGYEQLLAEGEEDSCTWSSAIRQRFEDPKMDESSKKIGVKLIVEMAFSMEPNQFRGTDPQFTFSNLLKTLSAELKDFQRTVVMPVLGEFHETRNLLENDQRVFMAVFYAELFVKLTLDNGSRFEKLGEALTDQLDEILKYSQKDEYMKCLLRVFKVAGAEMDASENLRKRVDHILTIMGGFANGSPMLGESVKAQILSLIECRQRGWDRVASGTEASSYNPGQDSFDESLDNDLTEEERQFLESHLEQADKADEGDVLDDQEVMNEFGKFVKEELLHSEELKTTEMLTNLTVADEEPTAAK